MKQKIVLKYEARPNWYKVIKLVNRIEPQMGLILECSEAKKLMESIKSIGKDVTVEIQ